MNKNDEEKKWMTLEEASKLLTTPNGHVSKQTLWRWATTGCRGIRLKTMRFGRRIYVTEKDLEGFSRELAENWDCSRYYDRACVKTRYCLPALA